MQIMVLVISLVLMTIIAAVFLAAARSAPETAPAGAEAKRKALILGLITVGVIVSAGSLARWPHAVDPAASAAMVNVSGGQWYWEIDTEEVPLGAPVIFNAHTVDVTHGFGVTDDAGTILFQTQAMPGYVNRVQYTFETPGTYQVICLEFCGLAHHDMITEFTVAAAN
jgi:cytochrome c oxidase subunit 2